MFEEVAPQATAGLGAGRRALYLRWRPRRFEDVVGQEHVTRTLRNAVKNDCLAHAYLFTGPRGTGKTSVARILYRAANCPNAAAADGDPCNACPTCRAALDGRALDLVEIDAASNRGIDDIRDLREKIAYRPGEGRYRLYIIDEAHELTTPAWDAFLKTLEEPPPHALFVLATTEAHKVPPTIVSRCQRFDFRRIPFAATREQLAKVAEAEGMQVEPAVLERLALVARGGLRDAISLLDQLGSFAGAHIDMQVARAVLSLPSIEAVRRGLDGLTRRDPAAVMADLDEVAEGGADLRLFVEELVTSLRALLLVRSRADARLADEMPAEEADWLRQRAPGWTVGGLIGLITELSNALARTKDAQQFQIQTELALLAACETAAERHEDALEQEGPGGAKAPREAPRTDAAAERSSEAGLREARPSAPSIEAPPEQAPVPSTLAVASAPAETPDLGTIQARWPDVVDYVTQRKRMLGVMMSSTQPLGLEEGGQRLVVGFGTDFNLKRAEQFGNRQAIEEGVRHVYGRSYRLRCTLGAGGEGTALLDDPVISYAVRTFGGEPRRVES